MLMRSWTTLWSLLVLGWLHIGHCLNCNISDTELLALHDFYNATNGPSWKWDLLLPTTTVWTFPAYLSDPCGNDWQGIQCTTLTAAECTVTGLNLSNYGLLGYLPTSVENLTNLVTFNVSDNKLSSTLPLAKTLSADCWQNSHTPLL
jgi:hypothetical protein